MTLFEGAGNKLLMGECALLPLFLKPWLIWNGEIRDSGMPSNSLNHTNLSTLQVETVESATHIVQSKNLLWFKTTQSYLQQKRGILDVTILIHWSSTLKLESKAPANNKVSCCLSLFSDSVCPMGILGRKVVLSKKWVFQGPLPNEIITISNAK